MGNCQTVSERERFFVITTIFNPAQYDSRYNLYYDFVRHMKESGAQLITIECIFPTLGQTKFQVTSRGNPYHIQVKSNSLYWVKESLINYAAKRLPAHAKWVCWLDADITFHQRDWVDQAINKLKKHTVIQMFDKALFLGPDGSPQRIDYSFGYSVKHKKIIDQKRYAEWYPHPGYGWGMQLEAFLLIGGLPVYDVLGSADLHFAFSLLGRVSSTLENDLDENFKKYIIASSHRNYKTLIEYTEKYRRKLVGYLPITISHNWHGSRENRQYVNRWKILVHHKFDYVRDTYQQDEMIRFRNPAIERDIYSYFKSRDEDSRRVEPPPFQDRKDLLRVPQMRDQITTIPSRSPIPRKDSESQTLSRGGQQKIPTSDWGAFSFPEEIQTQIFSVSQRHSDESSAPCHRPSHCEPRTDDGCHYDNDYHGSIRVTGHY